MVKRSVPDGFQWMVSTCSEGIGSGGDRWTKRVLQKAKEVSNKDHLIAAKEKTTWNMTKELSDKRRGDKDGANPHNVPSKK
jgi:hypothetical protein